MKYTVYSDKNFCRLEVLYIHKEKNNYSKSYRSFVIQEDEYNNFLKKIKDSSGKKIKNAKTHPLGKKLISFSAINHTGDTHYMRFLTDQHSIPFGYIQPNGIFTDEYSPPGTVVDHYSEEGIPQMFFRLAYS